MSSFTVFALKSPKTAFGFAKFSVSILFNIDKASTYNSFAFVPTISSSKIAGNFPCKSHVLKNGVQSIKSFKSETVASCVKTPNLVGLKGLFSSKLIFNLFFRASSIVKYSFATARFKYPSLIFV